MLKYLAIISLVAQSTNLFGQLGVTEKFRDITTQEQAQKFISENAHLKPALLNISAEKDTTIIARRLLRQNKGDVFSVGYFTYKVLESEGTVDFRASYIFLDGSEYSPQQIDSLRKLIVQKASQGVPFESLADQYSMAGTETHGDTGWFSGEYSFPQEFQSAVQAHKVGDIFFAEVADKQWYYIIKKTYDDRVQKKMILLRSVGR